MCLFSKVKIPFSWFLLEQEILRFAGDKNTKIVQVSECARIAAYLQITPEILEAALLYFHSLNVFLYYPNVLPGLVFIELQFPLNCLFEFVAFQFKLTHRVEKVVNAAVLYHIEKGIITLEMMGSDCFSKCFVPKLYGPEQAIKLFQSLFIAAPLGNGKYLMPFLLSMMPKTELHKHVPTCSYSAPLLVLFKNKSESNVAETLETAFVPNGVFCGLVAHLLSEDNWVISLKEIDENDDSIKCLKRNIAILSHSNFPVEITIISMQA